MLQVFVATALFMLVLDLIWLSLNADYHNTLIKSVQGSQASLRVTPAVLVYVLIPAAVLYFAVYPAKSAKEAATKGALLGASMYGLYDLTNLASLKGWTTEMAIKDTLWGTVLCSAGAVAGFGLHRS